MFYHGSKDIKARKCSITVVKWYQGRKCSITVVKWYQGRRCSITAVKRYQGRKCYITVETRYQGRKCSITGSKDTNGALYCFDCFYGRFGDQEVLLAINFDGKNFNMTPTLLVIFSLYGLVFFLTKSLLEIARQWSLLKNLQF